MSGIVDAIAQYQADLSALGMRVTMDPRNLNPPCVLFVPPRVEMDVNCGGTATFKCFFIAPGPANLDAWRVADKMAASAAGVLDIETLEPSSYGVDETGVLPALEATWEGTVSWP